MGVWRSFAIGGNMVTRICEKLVECEVFIDPVRIESTQLKEFFF